MKGRIAGPRVSITGLGTYAPEKVVTNDDLSKLVETNDEWIRSRTGIRERRIAAPEEASSDLAIAASRDALANAGVDPAEIDLVIVATVTPDMLFPATAALVGFGDTGPRRGGIERGGRDHGGLREGERTAEQDTGAGNLFLG